VTVTNPPEAVSTPGVLTGPVSGSKGVSYTYTTGGSSSNLGHSIQYLFDWGDGTKSGWLPAGTATVTKSWPSADTYKVKAQARCATHPSVVSSWSPELTVIILAPITLHSPLNSTHFTACSFYLPPVFSWVSEATFKSYEIQFSLDGSFNSVPLKVKVQSASTQITLPSGTWKKVMLTPGASGGTVYWRVVGTRPDKTTFTSETCSILIEPPQSVSGPTMSPTSTHSLPELSWQNDCNTKFKVWFGSDSGFTKKVSCAFSLKNPNENGGKFQKGLTSGQWQGIKKLVNDVAGSTIFWYVESWDGLGRYVKSEVKNFVMAN
jgi:hypothetical protein